MRCFQQITLIGVSAAFLLSPLALAARGDDTAKKADAKPAKQSAAPPAKAKPKLSPELAALRDQVRQQLAAQQKQTFNTRQNSATEILSVCLAFGCNSEVSLEGPDGNRINGIACLCWNYPCQGFELLGSYNDHLAAQIGYGYQEHPGEFLATLAMSRVPENYQIRAGGKSRTIADLVEAEKLGCRTGGDNSFKLIGLAYYVADPEWKNDLGETCSIERMIDDLLDQPMARMSDGGQDRLLAVSYALARRSKSGRPIEGAFLRAQKYIAQCQEYLLRQQDGGLGSVFFAGNSASPDAAALCAPAAARWSGSPSPCPRRSSPIPASSVRSNRCSAWLAASATNGTHRRCRRRRLSRSDTPCTRWRSTISERLPASTPTRSSRPPLPPQARSSRLAQGDGQ